MLKLLYARGRHIITVIIVLAMLAGMYSILTKPSEAGDVLLADPQTSVVTTKVLPHTQDNNGNNILEVAVKASFDIPVGDSPLNTDVYVRLAMTNLMPTMDAKLMEISDLTLYIGGERRNPAEVFDTIGDASDTILGGGDENKIFLSNLTQAAVDYFPLNTSTKLLFELSVFVKNNDPNMIYPILTHPAYEDIHKDKFFILSATYHDQQGETVGEEAGASLDVKNTTYSTAGDFSTKIDWEKSQLEVANPITISDNIGLSEAAILVIDNRKLQASSISRPLADDPEMPNNWKAYVDEHIAPIKGALVAGKGYSFNPARPFFHTFDAPLIFNFKDNSYISDGLFRESSVENPSLLPAGLTTFSVPTGATEKDLSLVLIVENIAGYVSSAELAYEGEPLLPDEKPVSTTGTGNAGSPNTSGLSLDLVLFSGIILSLLALLLGTVAYRRKLSLKTSR